MAWRRNVASYPESLSALDDLAKGLQLDGQPAQAQRTREEALALAERLGSADEADRRTALATSLVP